MTMEIATYKNALKAWVESQAGITAQWRDEQGVWQSKTRARLHLINSRFRGVDFLTNELDGSLPTGKDFVPTVKGVREITLIITVHSRNQSGNNTAMWYLEKLRTSLRKPSVRVDLRAAGLAHSTSEQPVDLDGWVDDRKESRASLDIHFNAVVNERDEAEADSYVETVETTAELTTPAGVDVGWIDEPLGD